MIFEEFNPSEDKILRIIDNDGRILRPDLFPEISDDTIVKAWKAMLQHVDYFWKKGKQGKTA